MQTSPSSGHEHPDQLLNSLQFHLMELGFGKVSIDLILAQLENDIQRLEQLGFHEIHNLHSHFEELEIHLNSRDRFINAAKLQLEIAKSRKHPHIAELKQLIDQITRHVNSPKCLYFVGCFQTALVNPGKKEKHEIDRILENIKLHPNDHAHYIDQLHRNLTHFYF